MFDTLIAFSIYNYIHMLHDSKDLVFSIHGLIPWGPGPLWELEKHLLNKWIEEEGSGLRKRFILRKFQFWSKKSNISWDTYMAPTTSLGEMWENKKKFIWFHEIYCNFQKSLAHWQGLARGTGVTLQLLDIVEE